MWMDEQQINDWWTRDEQEINQRWMRDDQEMKSGEQRWTRDEKRWTKDEKRWTSYIFEHQINKSYVAGEEKQMNTRKTREYVNSWCTMYDQWMNNWWTADKQEKNGSGRPNLFDLAMLLKVSKCVCISNFWGYVTRNNLATDLWRKSVKMFSVMMQQRTKM